MAITEIRIIERASKKQPTYKYTFEVWEDGRVHDPGYYHNTNFIANRLVQNPIKVQKQMEKFGGINVKETTERSWGREFTFTYFQTLEDAEKAKDWLDSMIINYQMVGRDELRRQQEEKSNENHEKRVKKALDKLLPFKGTKVKIVIESYNGNNKFTMEDTIDEIQRNRNEFIITLKSSQIKSLYSEFEVCIDHIKVKDNNMNSSIKLFFK